MWDKTTNWSEKTNLNLSKKTTNLNLNLREKTANMNMNLREKTTNECTLLLKAS